MTRESAAAKARRYLAEGRLTVLEVGPQIVRAVCRGDSQVRPDRQARRIVRPLFWLIQREPGFDSVEPLQDAVQPAGHVVLLGPLLHEVGPIGVAGTRRCPSSDRGPGQGLTRARRAARSATVVLSKERRGGLQLARTRTQAT